MSVAGTRIVKGQDKKSESVRLSNRYMRLDTGHDLQSSKTHRDSLLSLSSVRVNGLVAFFFSALRQ